MRSFHHKNIITRSKKTEKSKTNKDSFRLITKTKLVTTENKIKEESKGQKEVWTAKKGDFRKTNTKLR